MSTLVETYRITNANWHLHPWQTPENGRPWGKIVDHTMIFDFDNVTVPDGHHARAQDGRDTFNFTNIAEVKTTVVGRFEDFDPTRDRIQIEGVTLNFAKLPSNVKVVSYNGDHNDPGTDSQQWLLIDTGPGYLFYSLEGARVDMNNDGGGNNGEHETHFIKSRPNFSTLKEVTYTNPFNHVPAGYSPDGGKVIHDGYITSTDTFCWGDRHVADVKAPVRGTSKGDLIAAGLNDDTVLGDGGNDRIWGGDGHDEVRGDAGSDVLHGNFGNDRIFGGSGADTLNGGNGNDVLDGGFQNDSLLGGLGADRLVGGADADHLDGGMGNDSLYGSSGADVFVFSRGGDKDIVFDFQDDFDTISFSVPGITTWSQLRSKATQVGDDVVFDFGAGDVLTVRNAEIADLPNDVVFS